MSDGSSRERAPASRARRYVRSVSLTYTWRKAVMGRRAPASLIMTIESPILSSVGTACRNSPVAPNTRLRNPTSRSASRATMRGVTVCQPFGTKVDARPACDIALSGIRPARTAVGKFRYARIHHVPRLGAGGPDVGTRPIPTRIVEAPGPNADEVGAGRRRRIEG